MSESKGMERNKRDGIDEESYGASGVGREERSMIAAFQGGGRTQRSPVEERTKKKGKHSEGSDEIYNLFLEQIREIREELRIMREERKEDIERHRAEREEWKSEISEVRKELSFYKTRLERMEARERENNIIFRGVEETQEQENTNEVVRNVIGNKMECANFKIGNAVRLGRKEEGRIRPILVKAENKEEKTRIFRMRTKLKGTKIYVEDDLAREEREKRRGMLRRMQVLRGEGKNVYVRGFNKLMIDGKLYQYKCDEQGERLDEYTQYRPKN